jgi:hypothetical protein
MKMVLKLAPTNGFVVVSLFLHGFHGLPAMLEGYQYAIGESETIGNFALTFIVLILSETWFCYRFRDGYFEAPIPGYTKVIAVVTVLLVVVVFPGVWFGLLKRGKSKQG